MGNANSRFNPVEDHSISPGAANLYALAISLPLVGLLLALYEVLSPKPSPLFRLTGFLGILLFIAALVVGIFAHEIIHGLAWAFFGRMPLRRIRLGYQARTMTPYAHALDPMPARSYRIGAALPALLLGALPFIVGTILGRPSVALFGIVFSCTAGGDLLVLWVTRNVDGGAMVQDHPSRAGCVVVSHKEE